MWKGEKRLFSTFAHMYLLKWKDYEWKVGKAPWQPGRRRWRGIIMKAIGIPTHPIHCWDLKLLHTNNIMKWLSDSPLFTWTNFNLSEHLSCCHLRIPIDMTWSTTRHQGDGDLNINKCHLKFNEYTHKRFLTVSTSVSYIYVFII